ncbi:uncharacterized protein LOC133196757 [Saccostrea echinata]|uniref:uncharacterized protein LOC133196757 n=1 Tax=Saccostrea echinata TaxID=191078 RepID=UPI002A806BD0|nr:uncharacterized protein LOC133196757 [Saccostrea echinata]XP_061188602.1 uncharacterized protein LOC133196757 [Saccostrea echinata]
MAQNTSSSHWREQGNGIYITARDNLCPSIRKERLRQAANCYYKAYNFSTNEDEKVSAAKNLAMVSWKTARVDEACLERFSLMIHQYKESFKYFSFGFHHSVNVKPESWRDGLLASAKSCWEELRAGRVSELTMENRDHTYHDLVQHMQIPEIQAECYIELTNCHFHCGITAIQNKDFKRGLYEMRDCYMPINEAKRLQGDKANLQAEVRILEEDVFMHQCMAESLQAISVGDQLYGKLLLDEEALNMDMVYEVIDWYKQAVVRTREVTEVEMEAVALSRLGRVYDKILKIKYKAKEYLMRSMQLAHSMHPRTFNSEDWFKDCAEILERYQKETVSAEEEKWNKEREEIIKGIEKEMKNIEKADDKDSQEFLRYVYRVFPPKNKEHKLDGNVKKKGSYVDHCALKKTLQKAIIHYHPDKVDMEKHGKVWKVLSEEITKRLTRRYEAMK